MAGEAQCLTSALKPTAVLAQIHPFQPMIPSSKTKAYLFRREDAIEDLVKKFENEAKKTLKSVESGTSGETDESDENGEDVNEENADNGEAVEVASFRRLLSRGAKYKKPEGIVKIVNAVGGWKGQTSAASSIDDDFDDELLSEDDIPLEFPDGQKPANLEAAVQLYRQLMALFGKDDLKAFSRLVTDRTRKQKMTEAFNFYQANVRVGLEMWIPVDVTEAIAREAMTTIPGGEQTIKRHIDCQFKLKELFNSIKKSKPSKNQVLMLPPDCDGLKLPSEV
ncbi:hypothetical protein DFJ74DRAFT_641007 [Hyaloraphidium curvatum]|nr:hypothetical protein DFJ74DRAFT_641007 [Hyaloraphidium curvatum]